MLSLDSTTLSTLLLVASIQLLGVMSPGPDFALIVRTSLAYSRQTAIWASLGLVCGVFVHLSYCLLGVAVIIMQSHWLFMLFKGLGAAYFIYIGIKSFLAKRPDEKVLATHHHHHALPYKTALRQGFFCNLLNPKAMLFFLGLFTLVIKPTTPLALQFAIAFEILLLTFLWFAFLSIIITHRAVKKRMSGFQYYITKCMGVFFIVFGITIMAANPL
jgi:RhtB (resistance to homoserine/threonine) family protein